MPSLRIVLEPERQGLGFDVTPEQVIHLADEAEIVVSGLPDGMVGGRPSMMFGFRLPDGRVVIAETSWRLFATAYKAFLGKFGEPDMPGMRLEMPDEGRALEFVKSEKPFVQCGSCSWRLDGENTEASVAHLVREYERHYRKKHRGVPPPPPFPGRN